MAGYFYDTSAFAKAYHAECGTAKVVELLSDTESSHFVSSLSIVEFQSVFAQKVRSGEIDAADFQLIRRKFGGEIRARRLQIRGLVRSHLRAAERLIIQHAPTRRLRTLDALQLAIALDLASAGSATTFVVSDVSLGEVARIEGLQVINPDDWP
jgi:uncharacterized protein